MQVILVQSPNERDFNHQYPVRQSAPTYPAITTLSHALYRVAIGPKTLADSTKISPTLTRLCEEDMTLSWNMEASTNQTILQGMETNILTLPSAGRIPSSGGVDDRRAKGTVPGDHYQKIPGNVPS